MAPPRLEERAATDASNRPADASWKISPALRNVTAGKVLVQVYVSDLNEATLKKLKDAGLEPLAQPASNRIVVGRIEASKLMALAKLAEVRFIAPQQ
jgi:isopentenyl phosphate kinase